MLKQTNAKNLEKATTKKCLEDKQNIFNSFPGLRQLDLQELDHVVPRLVWVPFLNNVIIFGLIHTPSPSSLCRYIIFGCRTSSPSLSSLSSSSSSLFSVSRLTWTHIIIVILIINDSSSSSSSSSSSVPRLTWTRLSWRPRELVELVVASFPPAPCQGSTFSGNYIILMLLFFFISFGWCYCSRYCCCCCFFPLTPCQILTFSGNYMILMLLLLFCSLLVGII